jgi:hypothetical protein
MDFNKIKLFINTIIYLRPIQVYYRLYYFLRNRLFVYNVKKKNIYDFNPIAWENRFDYENSYFKKENSFTFLNISHFFSDKINWNFNQFGKLWTYNLNYFDFLNQENISKENGLRLIQDFINNDAFLIDGKEPYPISLRGINWVKFLSNNQVKDEQINKTLYFHYCILFKNLEYHLLGNHLLENAFSLLFGAYYFQDEKLYNKSKDLLISELNEQVLKDGAHFELSPMYHQIILSRLLDSVQLIKINKAWKKDNLISFLEHKSSLMISWLHNITYKNGNIPMVNDSTFNIAPNSEKLFLYAKGLGISNQEIPLSDSGYRKITSYNYELLLDIGNVGPDYQPGHGHSDTFNFELLKNGIPIFVDTGISTYEKNNLRQSERSTSSHNTVQIENLEQTQVWDSFRVAKRAKVNILKEKYNSIKASHDGYQNNGYCHTRTYIWEEKFIIIKDEINKSTNNKSKAFFHLHSSLNKPLIKENKVMLESLDSYITFINAASIEIDQYQLSQGFNKTEFAFKIIVTFDKSLETKILI